ncbi:MAG: hypothetical protein IPN52_12295 [Micrococcales bacterium]|nr:hypothetical protein [Micrococcales bacterium]
MSESIQFLPWFRTGLAATIEGDTGGTPVMLSLAVAVEAVRADDGDTEVTDLPGRSIRLHGPGAVTAVHDDQIIRRYPEPGATDPEPNYFCAVEFSSPDFPWRFTPAAPDADNRLQPWLALVVVEDVPGVLRSGPFGLDVLHIEDSARELPPPADVWAWAHVQVDSADPDVDPVALYARSPAALRSRLLCPRRLIADRSWIACVVPTYEAGRLAGLGIVNSGATGHAWPATGPVELPVYHTWRFRTSERGDFESLVRRLRPVELPPAVGVRDLDISRPGSGLPDAEGTIVSFVGALVSPAATARQWSPRHRRQTAAALREVLRDDVPQPAPDIDYDPLQHDPVVRPALYGSVQSQCTSLDDSAPRWMEQLNLDPSVRSVGRVGAAVVRRDQEQLMDAAWEAAKGLEEVNRRLRAATLALEAGTALQHRLDALPGERLLQFAGPSLARVAGGRGTLLRELKQSISPTPPDSAPTGGSPDRAVPSRATRSA